MAISNAEWEIMRVVWTKEETTSSEILDILEDKTDWTVSTVKTLLKRLVDKGYLSTQKVGKSFRYSALISENEVMKQETTDFFNKFCQRKHVEIVKHLLESMPMTEADVTLLDETLLARKENVLEEVPCDCVDGQCRCKEHLTLE